MPFGVPTSERPANTLTHDSLTTDAGTAVQVPLVAGCRGVLVTAKEANTGDVYLGGSGVSSASYGKLLEAGEGIWLGMEKPNQIWIDVSVNSEGVDLLYVQDL